MKKKLMSNQQQLNEGLNKEDLLDRVEPIVHFDEYVPKMGESDSTIVASFKVNGKTVAQDLENFIEKGYNWVLDAETSPGEISEGNYVVFVEAERRTSFPIVFMSMIEDLTNLTGIKSNEWTMMHYKDSIKEDSLELSEQNISNNIPLSPKKYRDNKAASAVLESMIMSARVPFKPVAKTHEAKRRT
jgi:hypothetical protein